MTYSPSSYSLTENVIPPLSDWARGGLRTALVTLVGIDGASPRSLGAQMAVAEDGSFAGYISGGCLEAAIVGEALEVMQSGQSRLVRYGKGSPYFDIQLPCGSGLDIFIQPLAEGRTLRDLADYVSARQPVTLTLNLDGGDFSLGSPGQDLNRVASGRDGNSFHRVYTPALRCLVIGSSPIAGALAGLAAEAGLEAIFYAPDPEVLQGMPPEVDVKPLANGNAFSTDRWTAGILAFHDHDQELPVLGALLQSDCFFLAAIGSRKAHEARIASLNQAGFRPDQTQRIKNPAGLVPGLKSAPLVAVSILAQIIAEAQAQSLV